MNRATITENAATAPAPIIIIVDCLCRSCFEISVGGSSDKMVSSVRMHVCVFSFPNHKIYIMIKFRFPFYLTEKKKTVKNEWKLYHAVR